MGRAARRARDRVDQRRGALSAKTRALTIHVATRWAAHVATRRVSVETTVLQSGGSRDSTRTAMPGLARPVSHAEQASVVKRRATTSVPALRNEHASGLAPPDAR